MRNFTLLLSLMLTTLFASAQLTVNQWGQTRVGHDCDSIYNGHSYYETSRDTTSALWVSGPDVNGNPARIIIGDAQLGKYRNVDIGEWYNPYENEHPNYNILHLHGLNGLKITKNSYASNVIAECNNTNHWIFDINTDVKASSFIVNSDARYKKNVRPLGDALGALSQLTGVSYNLKTEEEINELAMRAIKIWDAFLAEKAPTSTNEPIADDEG